MSIELDCGSSNANPTGDIDCPHERPAAALAPAFCRIPVRSLSDRHRARILMHLLALDETDRYLRFGYAASDAQLAHYADAIDFSRDEVYGVFNRRLELIATAHLARLPRAGAVSEAELGLSVLPKARGRGMGRRLFDRAVLHARNHRIDVLVVHTLSENAAMLHIATQAGATALRAGSEVLARLQLPRDDLQSHVAALLEDQAADLDFRIKRLAVRRHASQPDTPSAAEREQRSAPLLD